MLKNTLSDAQQALKIQFKNPELLKEAFVHRSYLNEHPEILNSNERLEFLGDSVLQILTSTELFLRFPHFPEGKLTSIRSNLVRSKTLAELAIKLNLGTYLLMSRGEEKSGGRENHSLLANTFEAVLGAIYLDRGMEISKKFLQVHLYPKIEELSQETIIYDFKSRFQEAVQEKKRLSPVYKVLTQEGPDHDKLFTIGVFIQDKLVAFGKGKSKQEAEQDAARIAIEEYKL